MINTHKLNPLNFQQKQLTIIHKTLMKAGLMDGGFKR